MSFSPENLSRIYHGLPALINDEPVERVLKGRAYQASLAMANGLSYSRIGKHLDGITAQTVKTHMRMAFARLGIHNRIQLAGYFPLGPANVLLSNRSLDDLTQLELQVLQGLSEGKIFKQITIGQSKDGSTARTHSSDVCAKWRIGDVDPSSRRLVATRVANGLRAKRVNEILGVTIPDDQTPRIKDVNKLTLPKIVELDPLVLLDN